MQLYDIDRLQAFLEGSYAFYPREVAPRVLHLGQLRLVVVGKLGLLVQRVGDGGVAVDTVIRISGYGAASIDLLRQAVLRVIGKIGLLRAKSAGRQGHGHRGYACRSHRLRQPNAPDDRLDSRRSLMPDNQATEADVKHKSQIHSFQIAFENTAYYSIVNLPCNRRYKQIMD